MFITSKDEGNVVFCDENMSYLEELLNSIDIKLLDITNQIKATDFGDAEHLCEKGEYLIGVGFCAMQRYLFDVLTDVKSSATIGPSKFK